jgi:hypothetical protein
VRGRVQRVQKQEKEVVSQGGTKTKPRENKFKGWFPRVHGATLILLYNINGFANQSMSSARHFV